MRSDKVSFEGALGETLAARLERPSGPARGWALFAHCFSCSKDIFAAQRIARRLTRHGFAVLRFDFTGLGQSEGDFANTNFSSNIEDLVQAARWLEAEHTAPGLLIGHSLGGAAVLAAAGKLPSVKAVATIGAPADADHVRHHFTDQIADIERDGEAEVSLAGRPFRIKKQFLDDIEGRKLDDAAARLKAALMVVHAPLDELVSINNATRLFVAAKHPKSFLSLDDADHLLTREGDAYHAADVIAAWALRYVEAGQWPDPPRPASGRSASVEETGLGGFHSWAAAGDHAFIVDEPEDVGGLDGGPDPYQILCAALAACTTMTLRMYANRKQLELGRIRTDVSLERETDDETGETREVFSRTLSVEGGAGDLEDKLVEIAGKCPVHRTLERASTIRTGMKQPG